MKILVTGGAGFIGSHLVDKLIQQGHMVVVIDNLSTGKRQNFNPDAKFYKLDIRSPKISEVFQKEKPEVIFHLAAQIDVRKSVNDPIEDAKTNILGSLNLIQSFISCCWRGYQQLSSIANKFIFSSTGGAIYGEVGKIPTPETISGQPISPYGVSKLAVEKYLYYYQQVFGLPSIVLRYANVYGPRQDPFGEAGVVGIFINKLLKKKQPIINGDGKQTRDFVYVDDVVTANVLAMKSSKNGIFNIGTGRETSINQLFRMTSRLTQPGAKQIYGPSKSGEQRRSCLDPTKAETQLGWKPKYDLEKGLRMSVQWFRKNL